MRWFGKTRSSPTHGRSFIIATESLMTSHIMGGKGQDAIKLVSVVSRILDTMRLVRRYGLKTTCDLRQSWLFTNHLILDIIGIKIKADGMGPFRLVRHNMYH